MRPTPGPLNPGRLEPVAGFGRRETTAGYVVRPRNPEEIAAAFELARSSGRFVALRGAGRSYGDAATLREGIVLDLTGLEERLEIDPETGRCELSAGVRLIDLCRAALALGWWPPVVTGTSRITMGGAVGMNVHGKNNAFVGPFGEHVEELDLVTPDGAARTLTPADPLFDWVFGSAGMLGVVTRVVLRLRRVPGPAVRVTEVRAGSWKGQFALFGEWGGPERADYVVASLDHFASGASAGRGIFQAASHAEGPAEPWKTKPASAWRALALATNRPTMRFLNGARARFARSGERTMDPFAFMFQLDGVPEWERAYGPAGFLQLQSFVPAARAQEAFESQRAALAAQGRESFLSVLKAHRADRFPLSPYLDGFSLALDLPATGDAAALRALMVREQERVIDAGGKFYLAKDSTLTPEQAARVLGPDALAGLRARKAEVDPQDLLRTDLALRLGLA